MNTRTPTVIAKDARATFFGAALALVALVASGCAATSHHAAVSVPDAVSTVYLVRHAEKQTGPDPALSSDGERRAQALATLLRSISFDAIYSTDTRRTRATAAPLQAAQAVALSLYDPRDPSSLDDLVNTLRTQPGRYLIVGHSNTTPDLVATLGGEPGAPIDEASEYDRLYVIVLTAAGTVTSDLLRYGAPYLGDADLSALRE